MTDAGREVAVVLRALEIRAARQEPQLATATQNVREALAFARSERAAWAEITQELGLAGPERPFVASRQPFKADGTAKDWAECVAEAQGILEEEEIDSRSIRLSLPGALDTPDILAVLAFGVLGAIAPSIGSRGGTVQDAFKEIQDAADSHSLPALIQKLFGSGSPASFMDSGARGMYHRFAHGHDLFWAIPEGVQRLGVFRGITEVFQHLLRDSFGRTGIPLPGTDRLGEVVARLFPASHGLDGILSLSDRSRFLSIKMTDVAASSVTALLLWIYERARGIEPASVRSAKLGVLAHGVCFAGIAAAAYVPGLAAAFPLRSHLNYVSLIAVARNAHRLWLATRAIAAANSDRFLELEDALDDLWNERKAAAADFDRDAWQLAVASGNASDR